MIVFALDSSFRTASAAILKDDVLIAEQWIDRGLTHSETLMPLVDSTFRMAELVPNEVDCYAVTAGPGSFTGLRIGISTVKGLAFSSDACAVPVSSMEAAAYAFPASDCVFVPVFDARGGRFFSAKFLLRTGCPPVRLEPDLVRTVPELTFLLQEEDARILFAGDAAQTVFERLNPHLASSSFILRHPLLRAFHVASAAMDTLKREAPILASDLSPRYLVPSQAERLYSQKESIV